MITRPTFSENPKLKSQLEAMIERKFKVEIGASYFML